MSALGRGPWALPRAVALRWNRFWFAGTDGLPLGLTRVSVAAAGSFLWAGTLPLLGHYYTDAGEFPTAAARVWSHEAVARFLMLDVLGSLPATAALFAVWGLALAALLLGWRTRLAAWTNWLLTVWFFYRNPSFTNGGDEVFRLVSFHLALGYTAVPVSGRALSLDRRRWARTTGAAAGEIVVPAWPIRMIQVQIGLVYLVAGFWKVVSEPWMDGSALVYALGNPTFSRLGAPDWPGVQPVFAFLTLSVAWWELLFPLLVAGGRRVRLGALAFGVLLHGSILMLMNIGVFPFIMLACYPAFLTADEVRGLLRAPGLRSAVPAPQPSASSSVSTPSGVVP